MVNTALHLGVALHASRPELAVNFGIAGSLDLQAELGRVCEITEDGFPEMGAESPEGFLDMERLGFPVLETGAQTFYGRLVNPAPPTGWVPAAPGITVNTVHGLSGTVEATRRRWPVHVESMESAAFFHAMLAFEVPFRAFRGISNHVEVRQRDKWEIRLAAENVQRFLINFLGTLLA
jgi:futalosine hydrolase